MSDDPSAAPLLLVTGASGLIGSRFCELYGSQFEILSATRSNGYNILDKATLRENLLTDLEGRKLDAVVHLAAYTDVSAAFSESGDKTGNCYRVNVEGTQHVAEIAAEFGAHLVHVSTDFVFAGNDPGNLSELDLPDPIEWYGETKLFAEEVVRNSKASWTIMRIAFPYQKSQGVRPDLVSFISQKLQAGEPLYLFGDQVITPTFADDIADAISRFCSEKSAGEIFHVMGPESLTPFQLGLTLAEITGAESSSITETSLVEYLKKDPRPRQKRLAMDTAKYQKYCDDRGYAIPISVREALSQ